MNASKLTAILQTRFDKQFGDCPTLKGLDAQVWSEGGEWPILDSIQPRERTRQPRFQWPQTPLAGRDIDQTVRLIDESFKKVSELAISMLCGAGKSTKLMATLLDRSTCCTVVCVQPSSPVADELQTYVASLYPNIVVTRQYSDQVKSLVYLSAGEFLTLLHKRKEIPDAIIVIDEYHSISPVYKAVQTVLSCINNKILCMTASNSRDLTDRDGVRIFANSQFTDQVKKIMSVATNSSDTTVLCVGCCPGYDIYNAANHYVGVTMAVRTIVDLSTRLDPTIQGQSLLMTYRTASVTELTQSLGRLARVVGSSGTYHYFTNTSPFSIVGQPKLYSRIYGALISAFAMGIESNVKSMVATLKCSSQFIVASSDTFHRSSIKQGSVAPSLTHSKTGSASIASCSSSVRPPKVDEIMRVSKVASGYMVDYAPKDPIKRALSFRAKTWTSKPPAQTFPSAIVRQDKLLGDLNVSGYISSQNSVKPTLLPEQLLHASDMQIVNDVLSGKTIPTYSADEFALIKRAWAVYLHLNSHRASQSSVLIEKNISNYFEAYQRMAEVFNAVN